MGEKSHTSAEVTESQDLYWHYVTIYPEFALTHLRMYITEAQWHHLFSATVIYFSRFFFVLFPFSPSTNMSSKIRGEITGPLVHQSVSYPASQFALQGHELYIVVWCVLWYYIIQKAIVSSGGARQCGSSCPSVCHSGVPDRKSGLRQDILDIFNPSVQSSIIISRISSDGVSTFNTVSVYTECVASSVDKM